MKKEARRRITSPDSKKQRGLRLSRDMIRTLTSTDLSRAVGGSCDTGSLTTEKTTTVLDGG